ADDLPGTSAARGLPHHPPADGALRGAPLDRALDGGPLDRALDGGPLDRTLEDGPLDRALEDGPLDRTLDGVLLNRRGYRFGWQATLVHRLPPSRRGACCTPYRTRLIQASGVYRFLAILRPARTFNTSYKELPDGSIRSSVAVRGFLLTR